MERHPTIHEQMQVLTSDREFFGTVEGFDGDDLRVRLAQAGGGSERIPQSWIDRVDEHVHLNRAGAEIDVGLKTARFQASNAPKPAPEQRAAAPAPSNKIWIWLIVAVVLILLLVMLF